MKIILEKLLNNISLSQEESRDIMFKIMSGEYDDAQIAGFLIALRAELGDAQITRLDVDEKAIPILHNKRVRPPARLLCHRRKALPHTLTRGYLQATKLSVAAHAINMPALNERCAHDGR